METTPFDTRSSLNPKGGLALLEKDPAKLSMQTVQPGGDSLFADMLEQKISQTTLSGSTSDPTTAAPGGKRPQSAATTVNGNGEPVTSGKAKRRAGACNNEPLNGITGKTTSEMINRASVPEMAKSTDEEALTPIQFQPVMASSLREDAPLSVAGPAGKKSLSLTEKAEPPEKAKTAIHLAKKVTEQAQTIPAIDSAPAGNPMAAAPADPAAPASHDVRSLSDRHADHRSPLERAEQQTESAFMQRAAEALQTKNDSPATDGAPAGNPMAAAAADPTAPASHDVRPLSDRHADHRSPLEKDERRTEPAFTQRAAEALQPKKDGPATDGALSDVLQTGPSHHDHWKRAGESKERASIVAAPQKPISAAGDVNATIGLTAPERMTLGGSPDKALPIGDAVMGTPGPAHDDQQSRNTTPNRQMRLPERDMFSFHMEMPNVAAPQDTRLPATIGPTGIEMQSVIDQIMEARQGAGNDFGRIRILLNPPNLGSVDLEIVVRGERVEVVMTAENATVQQALQSRGDDIRIALQRQDLKIEGFQVLLQDNGTSQQQAHSGETFRQNREHRERFDAKEDDPLAVPVFSPIAGAKSAAGLVSIFA